MIGEKVWKDVKAEVCKDDSYKDETWFQELSDYHKILLDDLKKLQIEIGVD